MAGRFCTMLDCVDTGFIPGGMLDELPLPSPIGATRAGGIDLNKPRSRAVLAAALALAIAPGGFTVADFAAKVRAMTGQASYTIRNAAYDLRNCAASTCRQARPLPPVLHLPRCRPDHQRPAYPPGTGHRASPGWRRRPADPPHSLPLDRHRPALPGAAPGDDGPVRRRRHRLRMTHRQRQHFVDRVPSSG